MNGLTGGRRYVHYSRASCDPLLPPEGRAQWQRQRLCSVPIKNGGPIGRHCCSLECCIAGVSVEMMMMLSLQQGCSLRGGDAPRASIPRHKFLQSSRAAREGPNAVLECTPFASFSLVSSLGDATAPNW